MKMRLFWASAALTFSCFLLSGCDGGDPEVDAGPEMDGEVTGECPTGTEDCDGVCVDVSGDRDNCGACGNVCGAGEACVDGSCDVLCPSGQTVCGGACVDTDTDRRHCGACDAACDAGEICAGGSCEISCPAGQTVCDGACVDTDSNPAHCGGCGDACETGQVCDSGSCAGGCSAGLMDCGGACVDTQNSPDHCGACDNACPTDTGAAGLCMAGSCRYVCDAGLGDCNADVGTTGGDGCETTTTTDPANCGACGIVCSLSNATAGCDAGACIIAACDSGWDDCDSDASTGCELDVSDDETNCGGCGITCGTSEVCLSGSCTALQGDTCATAIALSPGSNTVAWTAVTNDYLTTDPSCIPLDDVDGPDIVLTYTATGNEYVTLELPDEPSLASWVAVVSTSPCGTVTEDACIAEDIDPGLQGSFTLSAGTTAYIYVADTTWGSGPLDNPLTVNLTALDCATAAPLAIVSLDPADGATSSGLSPTFTATFDGPVDPTTGTITISSDVGSPIVYDLSTSPSEVTFSSGDTVVEIDPGVVFSAGENLSVTWSGLQGGACANTIAPPTSWDVEIFTPPCSPGVGGVVGNSISRIAGPTSSTEYFVAADEDPSGWVYVGSTTELQRVPKAGGAVEDVEALAGLGSTHLGYSMVIVGTHIFVIDDKTTGTSGRVHRISADGGATWAVGDFVTFPVAPEDFRSSTVYGGLVYMATSESGQAEIWSFDPGAATVPTMATLELTVTGESSCSGLTRDDTYYYLACGTGERLVRVPVGGGTAELVTDAFDMSGTSNSLFGDDLDGDGHHDVLYLQTWYEEVYYVCSPAGTAPFFAGELASFGTSNGSYGMGFDRIGNTLWLFDDDTEEFVSVQ